MTFEELLTQKLCEIEELKDNVFPLVVNEGVNAPYVSYNQTGGNSIKDLSGQSDLMSYTYTLNLLTRHYRSLKVLEKQVIDKVLETQGSIVEKKIQEVIVEAPNEMYEKETNLRRANIEFTVYF